MPTPTMSRTARPGSVQKSTKSSPGAPRATAASAAAGAAAARKKMAASGPPNKSILNFFKKVPPPEESMFVAGSAGIVLSLSQEQGPSNDNKKENNTERAAEEANGVDRSSGALIVAETRFNECSASIKRRRLSEDYTSGIEAKNTKRSTPKTAARGPFIDDSDSEDDDEITDESAALAVNHRDDTADRAVDPLRPLGGLTSFDETFFKPSPQSADNASSETINDIRNEQPNEDGNGNDDFQEFADDDFDFGVEDDFGGEEFRERKYMEEQARLEAEAMTASCPICGSSLEGRTSDQATVHVNACLDGGGANPTSGSTSKRVTTSTENHKAKTPEKVTEVSGSTERTHSPISGLSKRFMRTAQPRPGQANPFMLGGNGNNQTPGQPTGAAGNNSAFAKLMSGHAEDAAWATAAATETASRGKPAYERTCPFYKVMPGFFICVDAFRYGAVEGCRAYFLSHFHSDHYIGLTAKWCHGPIYCSNVTASLVRTQLGTAAKWVVGIDFNTAVDVPGTEGVRVTMIPANHCPGSSMFLFEKALPSPTSSKPRTHRILHCGDFRACRAHVDHPLLAPDTLDALSGKTRQQRIDVCYLDTTYLNPRYSFPPQDDVVSACAGLCATLDRSLREGREGDWDMALRRRAGTAGDANGNVRDFFKEKETGGSTSTANESEERDDSAPLTALSALGRPAPNRKRLLVICGTYSIGKERICKAIAQALNSKIYASPAKIKIVAQLGDPELTALMTSNATEAQVHMQMLMELRAETLAEYLEGYRGHFSHIVGFRPSGWNYRPSMANSDVATTAAKSTAAAAPASLSPSTLATTALLHGAGWRTRFGVRDLVPQRGSTREAMCFGAPYSEHSSFRELALFLMALRIDKVVPTVNVGSDVSRRRMKGWIDRWLSERRRGGLVRVFSEESVYEKEPKLWLGKDGLGGGAYW